MEDPLHFYAEVRVVASPGRPELEGAVGAIVGISEPPHPDTPPSFGVMLDGFDVVRVFSKEQIAPTGQDRQKSDYY
ncbi:hypothetical protein ACFYOY_39380 [Streptomyces sp. NPDC007875]|uniref:hypothetical protein n=1 Tax=Streptomyces sp. NPDC007875 TaxID=3364783 RepID=UPI0036C66A7C